MTAGSPHRGSVDLAIVGAGAAGIGAGRAATDLGLRFVLLEALPRIGGRAWTDAETFGLPWDRGCHWLHSASINPCRALADAYGFRYRRERRPVRVFTGERWANDAEESAAIVAIEGAFAAVEAAGRDGLDVPATDVIDLTGSWGRLIAADLAEELSVDADQASTLDWSRYHDTDENWPVAAGYGALLARHAAELPVELETPVERIAWGNGGVRLTTPAGTIEAAAAILTVSVGVLQAERFAFDPPLPAWKRDAIGGLSPGRANKVAVGFAGEDPLAEAGVPDHTYALADDDPPFFCYLRPFGRLLAVLSVAGRAAANLERHGPAALREAAVERLGAMFGGTVRDRVRTTAGTSWGTDPTIMAAYSTAKPGRADSRAELARPVEDRLYFAGEATSPDSFGTAHGALLSGIAAAEAVGKLLGHVDTRNVDAG